MKNFLFIAAIFFLLSWSFINSQDVNEKITQINNYIRVIEIDKDTYRVDHRFPWSANSLLVRVGEKDFVLADTPIENTGSHALVEWLRETYGDVNLTVINCHFHIDCLGGNYYMLSQGFPVYASDMTLKLFEEDKENIIPRMLNGLNDPEMIDIVKNLQLAPPNHIFKAEEGLTLHFDWEDVEIYYPGPAHTEDNVVVYFPTQNILFGGCMVKGFEFNNLGYLAHANVNEWPESAQNLLDKYPDANIVVPGHGAHGDMTMVNHTLNLLKR